MDIWSFIFSNYELIFLLISVFVNLLLVIFGKRKLTNKDLNKLKEVVGMATTNVRKYRTENYQDREKSEGLTFSQFRKVYRFNKATNALEETDEVIDIQELVNSCKTACVDEILDRFLPTVSNVDIINDAISSNQDKLDVLREYSELIDGIRTKYNLSSDLSASDVMSFLQDKNSEMKKRVEELKNKEVPIDENKETK